MPGVTCEFAARWPWLLPRGAGSELGAFEPHGDLGSDSSDDYAPGDELQSDTPVELGRPVDIYFEPLSR